MSERYEEKTLAFIEDLKKSQPYIDYLNYKSFLDKKPELLEQVNDFRKKSFDIQVGHKYGYFNAYENLLSLNEEYDDLLNEPIVKQFLSAELEVAKMINTVFNTFAEGLDFELNFLSEE